MSRKTGASVWYTRRKTPHPLGVYLAWSVDRRVSFSTCIIRGELFYRVRFGLDEINIAVGGDQKFSDRDEAERFFLEQAADRRLLGSFGGTATDPDSIDLEIAQ